MWTWLLIFTLVSSLVSAIAGVLHDRAGWIFDRSGDLSPIELAAKPGRECREQGAFQEPQT